MSCLVKQYNGETRDIQADAVLALVGGFASKPCWCGKGEEGGGDCGSFRAQ